MNDGVAGNALSRVRHSDYGRFLEDYENQLRSLVLKTGFLWTSKCVTVDHFGRTGPDSHVMTDCPTVQRELPQTSSTPGQGTHGYSIAATGTAL